MNDVQGPPAEETALLDAYAAARREARELWRERRAVKRALDEEARAASLAGQVLPDWHVRAATSLIYRADQAFEQAARAETAALGDLSRYVDRQLAAAAAGASLAPAQVTP